LQWKNKVAIIFQTMGCIWENATVGVFLVHPKINSIFGNENDE